MSNQDCSKVVSGLIVLGGVGLGLSLVVSVAQAGTVSFDASTSALQATANSIVAAGAPLDTKDDQINFDFVLGYQGTTATDISAEASGAGYTGQTYSAASGATALDLDAEGLGVINFAATHSVGFAGAGAVSDGSLSQFAYFGSFTVDGEYHLSGALSSVDTTFAQLLIFDAADAGNIFAQIDGTGSFDVVLGSGNYVMQYVSEYAVANGVSPTAYAYSAGYVTVATAVPLPSSVLSGGVLLAGLALHRRLRRR